MTIKPHFSATAASGVCPFCDGSGLVDGIFPSQSLGPPAVSGAAPGAAVLLGVCEPRVPLARGTPHSPTGMGPLPAPCPKDLPAPLLLRPEMFLSRP